MRPPVVLLVPVALREAVINAIIRNDYSYEGVPKFELFADRLEITSTGIYRQAKAENLPEPTIEEIAGRIRFSVSLPEILPLTREQSRSARLRRLGSGLGSGLGSRAQSGAQSDRILFALTDSPLSTREIAIILDLETKSGALKRTVKQLLEEGIVEYTIPEKPNSRLQKYRLTAKGQSLITH